ncbi:EF-Tu/IF-2/RF-3 family GTPase, partial [Anaerococcus nagyae]|uniref:EF-Tu C-terminal domain-related protein n=1 Tax=Anaerococcus nagyae TaxID=1755241 RepID=UPI003736A880
GMTISGRGTVATGRVERGTLKVNDTVEIVGLTEKTKEAVVTGVEMVMPGDNATFKISLQKPIALEEGLRFAVREGGRTVASGVVTKVIK